MLTVIITHLDAARVRDQLAYLNALAPDSRFVVCHGGSREEFEQLDGEAVFVADPSLRGPNRDQSYNEVLKAVYDAFVRDDPSVERVYFMEYDQLILSGDFERRLLALAEQSGAGLIGKWASPRNGTNWPHHVRYRNDPALARFLASISRRDDPGTHWGCLGTGMLLHRDALAAFCALDEQPPFYLEFFIPTVIWHLGFDVADTEALTDLYGSVRWRPEYTVEEAIALKRAGRTFVHPFKALHDLDRIRLAG